MPGKSRCNYDGLLSGAKILPCSRSRKLRRTAAFPQKIFLFPFGRAYLFAKNWTRANHGFSILLKQNSSYRLRHGIKKKSDVMRTIEKIQRKRESINLPSSIGLVLKILATAVGFYVWGVEFIWVVLGVYFCWNILKAIASCLVSLVALIGFFYFLFTHIF